MIIKILELMLTALCAYIIGSIPTGYIVVKTKTGQDIRTIGSGSTGATNVKRVLGKKWFFIVLLLDAFKVFVQLFCATGSNKDGGDALLVQNPSQGLFGQCPALGLCLAVPLAQLCQQFWG